MKVELTYFKPSGKYYTTGYFEVPDDTPWHDLPTKVRKMISERDLPGLVKGCSEFDILMVPYENGEPGVPHLFVV